MSKGRRTIDLHIDDHQCRVILAEVSIEWPGIRSGFNKRGFNKRHVLAPEAISLGAGGWIFLILWSAGHSGDRGTCDREKLIPLRDRNTVVSGEERVSTNGNPLARKRA